MHVALWLHIAGNSPAIKESNDTLIDYWAQRILSEGKFFCGEKVASASLLDVIESEKAAAENGYFFHIAVPALNLRTYPTIKTSVYVRICKQHDLQEINCYHIWEIDRGS